jgi:hypothetical protein
MRDHDKTLGRIKEQTCSGLCIWQVGNQRGLEEPLGQYVGSFKWFGQGFFDHFSVH